MAVHLRSAIELLILFVVCQVSSAVLPSYIGNRLIGIVQRTDLIKHYFSLGLQYSEILAFLLSFHGIQLSLRQLRRILRREGLRGRKDHSDIEQVINAIETELEGSGNRIGYRQMHQRLRNDYGFVVQKEIVREIIKELDPVGVQARSSKRLRRREYRAKGPNYIWHIDGYDKLKPFGFCIHGGIDGYSRRILWLEVGCTNNNPKIIANYFTDCIRQIGGVPRIVRADAGTENISVAGIQRFLRSGTEDAFSGEKSFLYGRSVSNQRIEAWWSFLKKSNASWWIDFFKDMRDEGVFCDHDPIHIDCLRFCFMPLMQQELHTVAKQWNLHNIRPSHNAESPSGRPDILYFVPSWTDTRDYMTEVDLDDIDIIEDVCCDRTSPTHCSDECRELVDIIMQEQHLQIPTNAQEARDLFVDLVYHIENT